MLSYPIVLEKVIENFKKMPGIGPKSAERIAFFLLNASEQYLKELSNAIENLKNKISQCPRCFALMDHHSPVCNICANTQRNKQLLCVVETYRDMLVIENTGNYDGYYHILGGRLSPLDGITPDKLSINALLKRIEEEKPTEVIMATNPNVEGDSTAYYISQLIKKQGVKVSRLAKGLPVGSDLEFADSLSLTNSFKNREEI